VFYGASRLRNTPQGGGDPREQPNAKTAQREEGQCLALLTQSMCQHGFHLACSSNHPASYALTGTIACQDGIQNDSRRNGHNRMKWAESNRNGANRQYPRTNRIGCSASQQHIHESNSRQNRLANRNALISKRIARRPNRIDSNWFLHGMCTHMSAHTFPPATDPGHDALHPRTDVPGFRLRIRLASPRIHYPGANKSGRRQCGAGSPGSYLAHRACRPVSNARVPAPAAVTLAAVGLPGAGRASGVGRPSWAGATIGSVESGGMGVGDSEHPPTEGIPPWHLASRWAVFDAPS